MGRLLDTIRQRQKPPEPQSKFTLQPERPAQPLVDFEVPTPVESSAQKVQPLRETVTELGHKTGTLAREVAQGIARTVGGIGLNIMNRIATRFGAQPIPEPTAEQVKQSKIGRFFFGETEVEEIETGIKKWAGIAKEYGAPNRLGIPLIIGGGIQALRIGLDLSGFGGGKSARQAFERALLHTDDVTKAGKILREVGVSEDLIKIYAPKFAAETEVASIKVGVKSLEDIIKQTAKTQKAARTIELEASGLRTKIRNLENVAKLDPFDELVTKELATARKRLSELTPKIAEDISIFAKSADEVGTFNRILAQRQLTTAKESLETLIRNPEPGDDELIKRLEEFITKTEQNIAKPPRQVVQPAVEDVVPAQNLSKSIRQLSTQQQRLKGELPPADITPPRPLASSVESPLTDRIAQTGPLVKERGFIESVKDSEQVSLQTKELIGQLPPEQQVYSVFTDVEAVARARARVDESREAALSYVMGAIKVDKEVVTTGLELMRKYRVEGNFTMEAEVAGNLAQKATEAGQAVQAFSILDNLSPDGVLVHAARRFEDAAPPAKIAELDSTVKVVINQIKKAGDETATQVGKEAEEILKSEGVTLPKKIELPPATRGVEARTPEEIASEAADKLTRRINVEQKTFKPDPIRDMVNTLYKVASEFLPKKNLPVPKSEIELIGQAIRERDVYRDVWDQAQDFVRAKYSGNEPALELLDEYFQTFLETPFSKKQLERAVGKGIKQEGVNMGQLVRQHYSVAKAQRGSLVDKLVAEASIPAETAQNLASKIEARFDELFKAKRESVLSNIFKERNQVNKTLIERIIEISNLGGFESEKFRPLIAKKLGIATLTDELAAKLVAQAEKIQALPFGYAKYRETQNLSEMIAREIPRTNLQKGKDWMLELANLPRTFMSSFFDFSFGLRQGLVALARHPQDFAAAFKSQFKPFLAEENYALLMDTVMKNPLFQMASDSRVAFADINAKMALREERYMSSLAERIPIIGRGVRATNRAYTAMANKLRMDTFSTLVKSAEDLGLNPRGNKELAEQIAGLVNDMTGRGSFGNLTLEKAAPFLNAVFFSPRLMMSRLNMLLPAKYVLAEPFVRKEYAKTMLAFGAMVTTILGLASASGLEVGTDSNSADFGKIKVGNTRIDVAGGFQQYLRMASQIISGKYVSSSTGKIITLGEGYKPLTRFDILMRGLESKEAPIFSLATTLLKGQDILGEKISVPGEIGKRFVPMLISDMWELYKDDPSLMPLGFLGILGVGIQTYAPPEAYIKLNEINNSPNPAKAFEELQKTDKILAQKVKTAKLQENFTEFDWSLTYMGVENGMRARFLVEQFKNKVSDQERSAMWEDLRKKRLISDKVAEQIRFLLKNPDYKVPGEK